MVIGKDKTVAIVTGANAGIGYGICKRLLESVTDLVLIMACRSPTRAKEAKDSLLMEYPNAHIDIELVDVANVKTVFSFCKTIQENYSHINYLFCNAGILSSSGLNWKRIFCMAFTDIVGLMEQADATIQTVGEMSDDGMGLVFEANVFGHYIMMREFEDLLDKSGDGRLLWTSSITSSKDFFDIEDWQGIKSLEPYESSKWATDLMSILVSEQYEQQNKKVSSYITSPGVVASGIAGLPGWVVAARVLCHHLLRFCGVTSQTVTARNGSVSNIYAALQTNLSYLNRYCSCVDRWGNPFVEARSIPDYDPITAEKLTQRCEATYQAFKKNNI